MSPDQCRISTEIIAGWRAIAMENGRLRVTILPEKGAELHQLIHLPSGLDLLFKTPWGLQPPGAPPRPGSGGSEFLWNYGGGWQELFPSAGEPATYCGRRVPFHGEVATLAWSDSIVLDRPSEVAVRFSVHCRQTPFRLERILRLQPGQPVLTLEETVENTSEETAHFVWGHHCVLGAPFVALACELEAPAGTLSTPPTPYEGTARLAPGQREAWPWARTRTGGWTDLRQVLGPDAHSHDDVYLTDLDAGWVAVRHPELRLTFRLDWDPAVFRWIVVWQPYGGAEATPLTGIYGLGIEPWTTSLNLEQAVAAGEAMVVPGGGSFRTSLSVTVLSDDEGAMR